MGGDGLMSININKYNVRKYLHVKDEFCNKNMWQESMIVEDNLRQELEKHNDLLENEQCVFEEHMRNIEKEHDDFIEANYESGLKLSVTREIKSNSMHENNIKYDSYFNYITESKLLKDAYDCDIRLKGVDILKKIYLEIECDIPFDDMPYDDILKLLYMDIELNIDENTNSRTDLLSALFISICSGNKMNKNSSGTKIQIPIFDFTTLKDKHNANATYGLPLSALHFNIVTIILSYIDIPSCDIYCRFLGEYIQCNGDISIDIQINSHEYLIIRGTTDGYVNDISLDPWYDVISDNLAKCILINYSPKYESIEMPEIDEIILQPYDESQKTIIYQSNELLTFEIFGQTIYLVPLSSDFTSWENIYDAFNDPLKNMLGNGMLLESQLYLHTSEPYYDFDVNITIIKLDKLKISNEKYMKLQTMMNEMM